MSGESTVSHAITTTKVSHNVFEDNVTRKESTKGTDREATAGDTSIHRAVVTMMVRVEIFGKVLVEKMREGANRPPAQNWRKRTAGAQKESSKGQLTTHHIWLDCDIKSQIFILSIKLARV